MTMIPIEDLYPHDANVRDDLGDLTELADSLRTVGQLQPLVVRKRPNGGWTILDGHRRYQAGLLAGVRGLNAIARRQGDSGTDTVVMLAASMHKQLSPLEQAAAFARLRRRGLSPALIAERTGHSVTTIRDRLTLLELPDEARDLVAAGTLTLTDATTLARQVHRGGSGEVRTIQRRSGWLTRQHPLAATVAQNCNHDGRTQVGGVACGQCWEDAIRRDERAKALADAVA